MITRCTYSYRLFAVMALGTSLLVHKVFGLQLNVIWVLFGKLGELVFWLFSIHTNFIVTELSKWIKGTSLICANSHLRNVWYVRSDVYKPYFILSLMNYFSVLKYHIICLLYFLYYSTEVIDCKGKKNVQWPNETSDIYLLVAYILLSCYKIKQDTKQESFHHLIK